MYKVTPFQTWIHSRTVMDNYQHLVTCSRTLSHHLHHAHARASGAVGWHRERLSWDCSTSTAPAPDCPWQCQPSPEQGLPRVCQHCPPAWGQSQLGQAQADPASPIKHIQEHPQSWGQPELLAATNKVAVF